jgi:hypothetical protein
MKLLLQTPKKSLNKAFLKQRPLRADMDLFKTNLITLLDKINEIEREENQKNHVRDFLLNTYYKNSNEVNTKGTQDLVIHNGKDNKSSVGVIIEAKRPTNKNEWISADKPNGKAFQELVLYYLRERIEENNIDIKFLVATNINEWYIFEASYFEKTFFQNKKFVKEYEEWRDGKKVTKDTKLFYNEIAKPFIDSLQSDVECTFFNIKNYETALKNESLEDDKNLIALLKILSPNHLLKVPFANDSNSLDKVFYSELLHLIGLTETKDGGKKLIQRQPEGSRNEGSLLENAIAQLESHDKILRLDNPSQYGSTHPERLFNVGLELVITWMNRILFLKLLEAQLLTYHKGDKKYAFLSLDKIKDYDELDKLFFNVLAKKVEERNSKINEVFSLVPYLNSSLFEPTELEHQTLFINALDVNMLLPFHSSSVVNKDKKRKDKLNGIAYLFEFLNAYDFSSDGSGEIQEDNKKLINASVLGLIFEKINGYKDGSFFTPGFITMYMCKETIRRSVIQKFRETNYKLTENTDIETNFKELYDQIENRKEANEIINSLKICDPAVGSGHFLVSALNEIIAIKSDLKILCDKDDKRLKEYHVEVVNDELVVTDEDGELYEYNPNNKESQRIQETLFHEKQTIIENCLFGVDINPNSVKICRLRLWVELLKNAYYKPENKQLETLPNIDINIKCGNSLISRFGLDADLKQALKKSKWNVESYQIAVQTYRHAQSKEEKWEMERLIKDIKSDFRSEINKNDPKLGKLYKLNGELTALTTQIGLFGMSPKEKKVFNKKVEVLSSDIKKLDTEIEEIKSNKIYENAFEWRFEFPEVLNNDGDFVGFDVVIGNPPYIQLQAMKEISEQLKQFEYQTYEKTGDIYSLFYEKGNLILINNGYLAYITSNKWMRAGYGKSTRNYFLTDTQPELLIDLGSGIFDEATVDSNILIFRKQPFNQPFFALDISKEKNVNNLEIFEVKHLIINPKTDESWIISTSVEQTIKEKIGRIGKPLKDWDIEIYRGILTGYNEAFIIDGAKKEELIAQDPKSAEILKPLLRGRDIKRYKAEFADLWLISTFPALKLDIENYPAIKSYLQSFGKRLHQTGEDFIDENGQKSKSRKKTGNKWFETQDQIGYYEGFEKEKIVYPNMTLFLPFIFDVKKLYTNQKCFIITSNTVNLKFLIGYLNSKTSHRWIRENCPELQGGTRELSKIFFENIPIPELTEIEQKPFVDLVEKVIKGKEREEDTSVLEKEIDQLVYELYDLTDEEIKIVENA